MTDEQMIQQALRAEAKSMVRHSSKYRLSWKFHPAGGDYQYETLVCTTWGFDHQEYWLPRNRPGLVSAIRRIQMRRMDGSKDLFDAAILEMLQAAFNRVERQAMKEAK